MWSFVYRVPYANPLVRSARTSSRPPLFHSSASLPPALGCDSQPARACAVLLNSVLLHERVVDAPPTRRVEIAASDMFNCHRATCSLTQFFQTLNFLGIAFAASFCSCCGLRALRFLANACLNVAPSCSHVAAHTGLAVGRVHRRRGGA